MDFEYSNIMKNVMKKKSGFIVNIILVLLMVIMGLGIVFSYQLEKEEISNQIENAKEFNPIDMDLSYSKLTPDYLSAEFASNYDDSINYCFVINEDYTSYIVAIKAEDMDQYQELIDFTYSDDLEAPAPITLQGMPQRIDDDLIELAIDSFNVFWGSEVVDKNSFEFILGDYFLDTTQQPTGDYSLMGLCIFNFLVFAIVFNVRKTKARKLSKRRQATLDRFGNKAIWDIDQEMNKPNTIYFKSQNLYFTNNHIVSTVSGFDIIPFEEIVHVYGCIYGKNANGTKSSVTIITRDGMKHEIAFITRNPKGNELVNQIVDRIKFTLPDIEYGFEDDFYMIDSSSKSIDVDTNKGEGSIKSNVLFGIIGAILGATLGGVIWIIVGKLGFVAGLAGYAMMFFALKGYRKFSGFLDKKGQIISFIIAILMIFMANYTMYALEYCKYYFNGSYTINNLVTSYMKLPKAFTLMDTWGDFIIDLVVGYLLSIWASAGIIRTIFSRQNK